MTVAIHDGWLACVDYLAAHCGIDEQSPDINRRYAAVLWLFADCIAAKTILEIGIGPTSVSGCTFIHNLAQRGGGHLISVDIDPTLPKLIYRDCAERQNVRWTVVHGDSLTAEIDLPPQIVDLLYIDGNHDAEHAEGDLRRYLPYLRPGGYLLIDDFPPQKGIGDGRAAIDAILPHAIHLAHDAPHGNGRLVWQRPL